LPGWGEILRELTESSQARGPLGPDFDGIRLKYLERLHTLTGHAVISYTSGWLSGKRGPDTLVVGDDVHAFMEVCRGVEEERLDLILHSPGGEAAAAEQIVEYLRSQFEYIRCFVPLQAKSAATMIALGCDEIVMGHHSELGPIDPQVTLMTAEGPRSGPAHAILRDFRRAQEETGQDLSKLAAWTPILRTYAGGLIEFCTQQVALAMALVEGWLERDMLRHPDMRLEDPDERRAAARRISQHFGSESSYDRFRTHERPIRLPELEEVGLRVRRLGSDDEELQDAVLSIYHATDLTFNGGAIKIVENHLGNRKVRMQQQIVAQPHPPPPPPLPEDGRDQSSS